MKTSRRAVLITAVSSALIVTTAPAQMPDSATMKLMEAVARRIAIVRMEPAAVRLAAGQTVEVTLRFLDAAGQPVTAQLPPGMGLPIQFQTRAADVVFPMTPVAGGMKVKLLGRRASTEPSQIQLLKPPYPLKETDPLNWESYPADLVVADAPTEKIEVTFIGGPYVGTSIKPDVKVFKVNAKYPETDPVVRWSSSNSQIATADATGRITFRAPGAVTITAENGGLRSPNPFTVVRNPVASIALAPNATRVRTGDVVWLRPAVKNAAGRNLADLNLNYGVSSGGAPNERANAAVYSDGSFVAEKPGVYTVFAESGGKLAQATIAVAPRNVQHDAKLVAHRPLLDFGTSEIMVFEGKDGRDYAYLGTFGNGDRMYVYDVTDPANPVVKDSVMVDARVINDIRVDTEKRPSIAVLTREGASNRKNGIVILDVNNPAHPVKLSEFTETVTSGVHDVWIHRNRVYLTNDGTGDMHIIDITDPKNPKESGKWSTGTEGRYLHDLIVENDIAYLSYWDDGLIVLDLGGAGKGGTLDKPVFVSQYKYGPFGSTHHAFRYKNYVFLADELFGPGSHANGPGGWVHVVDVSDLANPKEVAKYMVPEAGAHNVYAEDDKLYIAHYQGGLRVVDISGDLRGDLYQQGREIAWYHTAGQEGKAKTPNQAMAWSPQLYKGNIYVSDLNSGMWVIKIVPKTIIVP